jgi:Mg2+-importing ATPase
MIRGRAPLVAEETWRAGQLDWAARAGATAALEGLGSSETGLSADEAAARLRAIGPNAILSHGARPLQVLLRQLTSPLLILLVAAAAVSALVGERADAAIISAILLLSVGLGFVNEYRSERAVEALHSTVRHRAGVTRGGRRVSIDVTELVPGDVVHIDVGDVVPADLRLIEANRMECDQSVLTGESAPVAKDAGDATAGASPFDLPSCAFMGTVVRSGTGRGVVVRTASRTAFGRIAQRLGGRPPETAFQIGLRDFSRMLVWVTATLALSIFVVNTILRRPVLDSALFALAIAVGLTPQLLPAIVTIGLSTGARRLARLGVEPSAAPVRIGPLHRSGVNAAGTSAAPPGTGSTARPRCGCRDRASARRSAAARSGRASRGRSRARRSPAPGG